MVFCKPSQSTKKTAGFSLPGVLVGVGLIGISATIISRTVVDSRRTQKATELKLSSNKYQEAAINAVTEVVKAYVLDDCTGARWGGSGVANAFKELPLNTDSTEGISLKFTNAAPNLSGHSEVNARCQNPKSKASLDGGEYVQFCMEMNPTGASQIDKRIFEFLIVPVELATDKAIKCKDARGSASGVKVTWQMYSQVVNSKISGDAKDTSKSVMKESGVFMISMETESYSATCDVDATRIGKSNSCRVVVSGLGRQPPGLFKNNTRLNNVNWARTSPNVYDAFTTTATCETNLASTFMAQSQDGGTACTAAPVPPVPCALVVDRIPHSAQCDITASALGASPPRLLRNGTVVSGLTWTLIQDPETYKTRTFCDAAHDTAFYASSNVPGDTRTCKQGIRKWYRSIGNGDPHNFARVAIPGKPICPPHACSIRCEGSTWQGIAKAQGFNNYVYNGWRSMCKHRDGRYNYTSCGDNGHHDWNGTSWVRIRACSDAWTTYLTIYNPIPANFNPP